jgi:hypothetical protein
MDVDPIKVARVLPKSRWVGAVLARASVELKAGRPAEDVARQLFDSGRFTLKKARETVVALRGDPFSSFLKRREKTGSAENPVTKLFPAAVTERQFLEELDALCDARRSVAYRDDRLSGHTLTDFTINEGDCSLPINVKNAGTRFENAATLVGLDPNDCVPIPAYKAYDAIEKVPNLLYAISIDYGLIGKIEGTLLPRLTEDELHVWQALNKYDGPLIRDAEDDFVYSAVKKHWEAFSKHVSLPEFRVISARKSIRILQTLPKRTPGIGLRAWGTGASAEVNVHIAVASETTPWAAIRDRIMSEGARNIVDAVNRKKTEIVYDPEI